MEKSRECPSIKQLEILVFVNGTHLGLKTAKSVCAASINRIQTSYDGNKIKFKKKVPQTSFCDEE